MLRFNSLQSSFVFQAIVQEGREPIEFWTVLGGQDPYANDDSKYRLFAIETGPDGSIEAVEVFDFDQTNLSNRRVAILDAGRITIPSRKQGLSTVMSNSVQVILCKLT